MPIIGYQKKIKQLQNFLNRGALFPVILFEGPEHIGKLTIAREFIKGLQCSEKQFGGCGRCENCLGQDHDLMIINESLRLALRQE